MEDMEAGSGFWMFGFCAGRRHYTLRVSLPEGGRPAAVFALVNKFTTQILPWTWMTAWFCVPKILLSLKVNQLGDASSITLTRVRVDPTP